MILETPITPFPVEGDVVSKTTQHHRADKIFKDDPRGVYGSQPPAN